MLGAQARLRAGAPTDGWLTVLGARTRSCARAAVRFRARFYRRCLGCPRPTSRRGTRVRRPLLPGEPLRAGPAGAEECRARLSTFGRRERLAALALLAKRVGSHQRCTTDERRTVLSIHQRGGIDLDTLDAVALPPDLVGWAASQTAWATAAARRATRAAAPTAARTARTVLILRRATPCRCAVGGSPTTPESRGSHQHRNPSASRRRSRARSASSTNS